METAIIVGIVLLVVWQFSGSSQGVALLRNPQATPGPLDQILTGVAKVGAAVGTAVRTATTLGRAAATGGQAAGALPTAAEWAWQAGAETIVPNVALMGGAAYIPEVAPALVPGFIPAIPPAALTDIGAGTAVGVPAADAAPVSGVAGAIGGAAIAAAAFVAFNLLMHFAVPTYEEASAQWYDALRTYGEYLDVLGRTNPDLARQELLRWLLRDANAALPSVSQQPWLAQEAEQLRAQIAAYEEELTQVNLRLATQLAALR